MAAGDDWTRDEVTMVCFLYLYSERRRLDDKRFMSEVTGRTVKSISAKMDNLSRFDPIVQAEGRVGLTHGAKIDEIVWNDFQEHPERMITEAQRLIAESGCMDVDSVHRYYDVDGELFMDIPEGQDRDAIIRTRVNQGMFRRRVLYCADDRCCVTGINEPRLLVASHIKPWCECTPLEKTDVHNALCLNRLHDGLFDRFMMTIDDGGHIIYAPNLEDAIGEDFYESSVAKYDRIRVNARNRPLPEYILHHNRMFEKVNHVHLERCHQHPPIRANLCSVRSRTPASRFNTDSGSPCACSRWRTTSWV